MVGEEMEILVIDILRACIESCFLLCNCLICAFLWTWYWRNIVYTYVYRQEEIFCLISKYYIM